MAKTAQKTLVDEIKSEASKGRNKKNVAFLVASVIIIICVLFLLGSGNNDNGPGTLSAENKIKSKPNSGDQTQVANSQNPQNTSLNNVLGAQDAYPITTPSFDSNYSQTDYFAQQKQQEDQAISKLRSDINNLISDFNSVETYINIGSYFTAKLSASSAKSKANMLSTNVYVSGALNIKFLASDAAGKYYDAANHFDERATRQKNCNLFPGSYIYCGSYFYNPEQEYQEAKSLKSQLQSSIYTLY